MRSALIIALKDLRLRIRDRSAFIIGIIAPLGLAVIFNFILGDVTEGALELRYGVVDLDGGETGAQFVTMLRQIESQGVIQVEEFGSVADGERAVGDGVVSIFVLPPDLSEAVRAARAVEIEVIGDVDSPTATAVASSIAESFAAEVRAVQLAVGASTVLLAGSPPDIEEIVENVVSGETPISIGTIQAATRELDLTTFFVAGMAVFFLFFTVQFGVLALLEERQQGTMARLQTAPIQRSSIVIAKGIVSMILGVVSMTVLVVASTVILGAEWGDPIGVGLLVLCAVVAATGIMAIVAAYARTAEGAGNLQAIIAVALGMLGGIFFPGAMDDGVLAKLSYISPHRWFMTGLADLAGGGGVGVIVPSLLALLAFGLVAVVVAWSGLRKGLST